MPVPALPPLQIIAQIDSPMGIQNYDSILEQADGIMVSRGHLGLRIPVEKVGWGAVEEV